MMYGENEGVVASAHTGAGELPGVRRKRERHMDTLTLTELHCLPLRADDKVVTGRMLLELHRAVPDWHIVERDGLSYLQRVFACGSFGEALTFTDRVGALAQAEGHHPSLLTEAGRVCVSWWTHPLKGLHSNDFIMAAKTDALYQPPRIQTH